MKLENFYHKNEYGYIVTDLEIDYESKTYKVGETKTTKIANQKIKELKKLGFKEEQ